MSAYPFLKFLQVFHYNQWNQWRITFIAKIKLFTQLSKSSHHIYNIWLRKERNASANERNVRLLNINKTVILTRICIATIKWPFVFDHSVNKVLRQVKQHPSLFCVESTYVFIHEKWLRRLFIKLGKFCCNNYIKVFSRKLVFGCYR